MKMRSHPVEDLPKVPKDKVGWPWKRKITSHNYENISQNNWPSISIVTPTLNQGQYIEQTIRSVLLQGYPNLEYIIIDGGSTDNSIDIIRKYEPWLKYWVSEVDNGQANAINKGFQIAKGRIFSWLNSDDFLLPNALWIVGQAYNKNPDAVALVGSCYRIDPTGHVLNTIVPRELNPNQIAFWGGESGFFYQPACFFRRVDFEKTGPLNEDLHIAFDLDLWLKLAKLGNYSQVDDVLAAALIHDDAKTQANRLRMHVETISVQVMNGYFDAAINRLEQLISASTRKRRLISRGAFVRELIQTLIKQENKRSVYYWDLIEDSSNQRKANEG